MRDDRSRRPTSWSSETSASSSTSAARHVAARQDPNGALARGFLGFTWFPIDLQYRVVGRFIKDAQPQPIKVLNTFGELDEYKSEGVVEFSLLGQTLRLRPFTTRPKRFYFVFRDASSGQETYEAARFLYADLLDDGTTVLDFNQAYNPPCAFNPYTTCPIPIRENRLPMKVLAGEKAYPVHVPFGGERAIGSDGVRPGSDQGQTPAPTPDCGIVAQWDIVSNRPRTTHNERVPHAH